MGVGRKKKEEDVWIYIRYTSETLTFKNIHFGMFICQVYMVDNFLYTAHADPTTKKFRFGVMEKNLAVDHYTTPREGKSLIKHDGIGVIDLNAYKMDITSRPQIIPLANT